MFSTRISLVCGVSGDFRCGCDRSRCHRNGRSFGLTPVCLCNRVRGIPRNIGVTEADASSCRALQPCSSDTAPHSLPETPVPLPQGQTHARPHSASEGERVGTLPRPDATGALSWPTQRHLAKSPLFCGRRCLWWLLTLLQPMLLPGDPNYGVCNCRHQEASSGPKGDSDMKSPSLP